MRTKVALAFALAFGLATAAIAAESTGTVVSVDGQTVTLRLDDGTQVTHPIAPNVTIRTDEGTAIGSADLAQKRVQVELDESNRATSIEVVTEDTAAAPARSGDPNAMARDDDPDAMARDDDPDTMARNELPDTASPIALTALVGGLMLAAAYAARALRR
jgi:hypothetical protein